jgi:sec-independent protein translocase protein TatC
MSVEDPKGGVPPNGGEPSTSGSPPVQTPERAADPYGYYDSSNDLNGGVKAETPPETAIARPPKSPPPPPPPPDDEEDDEGMLRMSFMEHLEELRSRIIKAFMGLAVAFIICILFANDLWRIVSAPALVALKHLGFQPYLVQISPMESFSIIWVKLPMLASLFVASPWLLYQVWGFIAPGLYKRERRWAAPFVICTAGLFILGGLFAYFVAFRYGLEFLLGIGRDVSVTPMVSLTEYFDLFVNVMLGIGVVFELPVLIFFLTLLRIVSPRFLIRHSRYAILAIVVVAAIVTPTPDVFNLMLFAIPMVALYFIGVFAGYLLILRRENRRFPWLIVLMILFGILLVFGAGVWLAVWRYGFHVVQHWPYLVK